MRWGRRVLMGGRRGGKRGREGRRGIPIWKEGTGFELADLSN